MIDGNQIRAAIAAALCFLLASIMAAPSVESAAKPPGMRETLRFAAEMARGGSWREARFRWNLAIEQDPDNARVLNNLAVASEALGLFEQAREYYESALALAPDDFYTRENHRRFAGFWRELREREDEGQDHGSGSASLTPSSTPAKKKGKIERVTVELPMPPRLKLEGHESVLVASFLVEETNLLNINRELVRFLRSEFRKRSSLEVLDVTPPPPIPEQTVEDLLANSEFWKYLHREYGADLIVSGVLTYDRQDVSGFEDVDIVSPTTGQKVRQTRFVEREEFLYVLDIFFIDGPSGTLLFRDRLQRGAVFRGLQNDPITAFYEISDTIAGDVLAVVTTRSRRDTRVIFKK